MLQPDLNSIKLYFYNILSRNLSPAGLSWLDKTINSIKDEENEKVLFTSFSIAPRFTGKNKLLLNDEDIEQANTLKEGFRPANFTTDQASRILLLFHAYKNDIKLFFSKIEKILNAADINEQVAIYSSFSLFPHAEFFSGKAAEGIRTNITAVFDAIVLENPYTFEHLSEDAWNQMVLKAIFTNRPLYKIYGFAKRRNASLAKMISEFAHERWAAGRNVTPELWWALPPFLGDTFFKDIERLIESNNLLEKEAAHLVLAESSKKEPFTKFLNSSILSQINSKELTWEILGKKAELLK